MIHLIGSGTNINSHHGMLSGAYLRAFKNLGVKVSASARDDFANLNLSKITHLLVQDLSPAKPDFINWLIKQRKKYNFKCLLLTQDNFWGGWNPEPKINYIDTVINAYTNGAFDFILASSGEGNTAYEAAGIPSEYMCAVAGPSWWLDLKSRSPTRDIVFVGSKYNDREELQNQFMDRIISAGFSTSMFGANQDNGWVTFDNMHKAIQTGRICLALTTPITAKYFGFPTGRIFSSPCAKRLCITNNFSGMYALLNSTSIMVTPETVVDTIDFYLNNQEDYDSKLKAQAKHVINNHLYEHRASKILQCVF